MAALAALLPEFGSSTICGFISDRSASWGKRHGFADGFGLTLAFVAAESPLKRRRLVASPALRRFHYSQSAKPSPVEWSTTQHGDEG